MRRQFAVMHPRGFAKGHAGFLKGVRSGLFVLALMRCGPSPFAQSGVGHEEMRARAEAAYQAGDFLAAMADYERLVSLFPEEACLHGRLAGCALEEPGRLALVRRHLRIALRKGCGDPDLGYHQARLALLEYDHERARDLFAAYLQAGGKKARFREEAERAALDCAEVMWDPAEAVSVEVFDRIPADPDAAFRYYDPSVPGLRLVSIPPSLRTKMDLKFPQGRMALHDGDTVLVYASLGKKGQNGWDLHRIAIRMGEYTEPEVLGAGVNSPFDEQDAYLSREGMLYFSSNRPGGLGGFDIYAVPCGRDGRPTGQPFRMPYPINSVNDDFFFIPEEDGGAWMASNRAAVRGKVHAYHLGLGQGGMATGSIAWSPDEVEQEGLVLRVFSNGEEVNSATLEGGEMTHLAFDAGSGVRIVLENAQGEIVAEGFGDGSGAWALKRSAQGWDLEAQTDVLADWAVLSDLQVVPGGGIADSGGVGEVEPGDPVAAVSDGATASGWADWILAQSAAEPTGEDQASADAGASADASGDVSALRSQAVDETSVEASGEAAGSPLDEVTAGAGDERLVTPGGESQEAAPADVVPDETAPADVVSEEAAPATGEEEDEVGLAVSDLPSAFGEGNVEALMEWQPEAEAVVLMLEQDPEVVVDVWEAKAEEMLTLERDFLDEPDFSKAGELYDLLDGMESWAPESERMQPILQDGAALEDIRSMLDQWSAAVQSATKESLAKVAGEAALAYRRDRLAARELWRASDEDVNAIKGEWSAWREDHRDPVGIVDADNDWSRSEGEQVFDRWEATLLSAEEAWSRKDRSGWRGGWLTRERDLLTRSRTLWQDHLDELEALAAAEVTEEAVEPTMEGIVEDPGWEGHPSGDGKAQEEVVEEADASPESGSTASDGPAIDREDVLWSLLWPEEGAGADGEAVGIDAADPGRRDRDSWQAEVLESRNVDRAWQRLDDVLDGRGWAPVTDEEDWSALDRDVARAYFDLVEAILEELDNRHRSVADDRQVQIDAWDERAQRAEVQSGDGDWSQMEQARRAVRDAERDLAGTAARVSGNDAEGFAALMERRAAMLAVEEAWQEWDGAWRARGDALLAMGAMPDPEQQGDARPGSTDDQAQADRDLADAVERADPMEGNEMESGLPMEDGMAVELEPAPVMDAEEVENADVEVAEVAELEEVAAESVPGTAAVRQDEGDAGDAGLSVAEGPEGGRETEATDPWEARMARMMERFDELGVAYWTAAEKEALAAWRERREIAADEPGPESGRAARMEWDKQRFFNDRRWRSAWQALDASVFDARLDGGTDMASATGVVEGTGSSVAEPVADNDMEPASAGTAEGPVINSGAGSTQVSDAAAFGVILPEAEVVVQATGAGRPGRGLTLRPISREVLERAILSAPSAGAAATAESAEARFSAERGAPREEGVEYKVQVGAFRNPLPAALFASFDPMWAQRLASGVTRYMAGSFSYYDDAVVARDAIRELGYADAFVVRFTDGERVGSARPEPVDLAAERTERTVTSGAASRTDDAASQAASASPGLPTRPEEIPTWDGVRGRVFSVQVGAFKGVPDQEALSSLGILTREDAGADGWLRLFSGRFATQDEAEDHRNELRGRGRSDAFIVVYVNGRRIPLSEASTTAVAPLPGTETAEVRIPGPRPAAPAAEVASGNNPGWGVELGAFASTIPVRLANAILDAPLEWGISSFREEGRTTYRTVFVEEEVARAWLAESRAKGFINARLVRE